MITVPAYFSDAQRNATREAGAMAGLEVVRILNEPTAASLAYGFGDGARHTAMVYDLGGGTFDVSVVTVEGEVTEVLSSHGNNHLGGDDFDDLLLERSGRRVPQTARHRRVGPEHPPRDGAPVVGRRRPPRRSSASSRTRRSARRRWSPRTASRCISTWSCRATNTKR